MFEIALALATFAVTYIMVYLNGPLSVFKALRRPLGDNNPLRCFFCFSVWVGLFFGLFTSNFFVYGLGFAGAAIMLEQLYDHWS